MTTSATYSGEGRAFEIPSLNVLSSQWLAPGTPGTLLSVAPYSTKQLLCERGPSSNLLVEFRVIVSMHPASVSRAYTHADVLCQCSVWPAFWSQAPNWPTGGEIDTLEGVNMVQNSQSSLHTEPGCTVVNSVQTSTLINSADCSFQAHDNEGCAIQNPDPNSYGAALAASGGGVFVTELAEAGISCVVSGLTRYSRLSITHKLSTVSVFGSSRYVLSALFRVNGR